MTADPLLAAVLADPDADAPRLVYADWCEEHGDPARAEFIRVQIEAAGLHPNSRRRAALEARANALFAAHWVDWWRPVCERVGLPPTRPRSAVGGLVGLGLGPTGQPFRAIRTEVWPDYGENPAMVEWFGLAEFARGFVSHLHLPSGDAAPSVPEWVRVVPVRSLGLPPLTEKLWAAIDGPALGRVRSLQAGMSGPEGVGLIANSPHLRGVEELELGDWDDCASADDLEVLAGAAFAGRLRALAVSRDDEAAVALAGSAGLAGLRRLTLDFGPSCAEAARTLARLARSPHLAGLEELELNGTPLTPELTAAVERWPRLRRLAVYAALEVVAGLPGVEDLTLTVTADRVPSLLDWPGLARLRHLRVGVSHPPDDRTHGTLLPALADRLDPDRLETLRVIDARTPAGVRDVFARRFGDRAWIGP